MPDLTGLSGIVTAVVGRITESRPITIYGKEIEGLLKNRGVGSREARATGRKYEKRFDDIVGPFFKQTPIAGMPHPANLAAVRALQEVVRDCFGGEDVYGRGPNTNGLSAALWRSKKMDLTGLLPPKNSEGGTPPGNTRGPSVNPGANPMPAFPSGAEGGAPLLSGIGSGAGESAPLLIIAVIALVLLSKGNK